MIILDTHIWVWWVHGDTRLSEQHRSYLQASEAEGLGISIISCWEVAKLVEYGRLELPCPIGDWLDQALIYPGVQLLDLTPRVVVDSTQLPGAFHRDPADQLIVATAGIHNCERLTTDTKILAYPHVRTVQ